MMIQAQRCGAQCHPELCKLRSSGQSKPQPGEMPAPWFAQLVLCQRSISRDTGGLKFLRVLFKLCWEMINCSKPSSSIRAFVSAFVSASCWFSRCVPLIAVRCASSLAGPAADDSSPGLQEHAELAGKRFQLAAGVNNLPYALLWVFQHHQHTAVA